jgi:V/A-type H+-transporting ATPase subunit I
MDAINTVAILARTRVVEIEAGPACRNELRLQELTGGINRFRELLLQYDRYWARGRRIHSASVEAPRKVLDRALARIDAWRAKADPLIQQLQTQEEERTRLRVCQAVFSKLDSSAADFDLVTQAGPVLDSVTAILPAGAKLKLPSTFLQQTVPLEQEQYTLVVGPASRMAALRQQIKALKGRLLLRPPWLRGQPSETARLISAHLDGLDSRITQLRVALDALYEEFDLADTLGDLASLEWFVNHVGPLELAGELFVWITGWASDPDGNKLTRALTQEGVRALVRFPPPPPSLRAPQILDNPWWSRPFEIFASALGVPASSEADPSPVLAVVVPLLFGYMFGDVGHGLVLFIAGLLLSRRFPSARLLIAGGISATLFGFLFGGLFSREDIIPALWLHPLDEPVMILGVPLLFAVAVLSLGQILNAMEAAWRDELGRWVATDAGFLCLYLGAVASVWKPELRWVALVGLIWYLAGSAWYKRSLSGAVGAAGQLVENALQIVVNTISFARVGAFALAHAGLSSSLSILADTTSSPVAWLLVMIVGNLIVILLEGLVVSVQTTRLVLFEFFNRFLRGEGRIFHPLSPPPTVV